MNHCSNFCRCVNSKFTLGKQIPIWFCVKCGKPAPRLPDKNEQFKYLKPDVGNPDGSPIYPDPTDPAQKGY